MMKLLSILKSIQTLTVSYHKSYVAVEHINSVKNATFLEQQCKLAQTEKNQTTLDLDPFRTLIIAMRVRYVNVILLVICLIFYHSVSRRFYGKLIHILSNFSQPHGVP